MEGRTCSASYVSVLEDGGRSSSMCKFGRDALEPSSLHSALGLLRLKPRLFPTVIVKSISPTPSSNAISSPGYQKQAIQSKQEGSFAHSPLCHRAYKDVSPLAWAVTPYIASYFLMIGLTGGRGFGCSTPLGGPFGLNQLSSSSSSSSSSSWLKGLVS